MPITFPLAKIKRFSTHNKLPEGLYINETSGEIYGTPLVKEMSLTEYSIKCFVVSDVSYVYLTTIKIGITSIYCLYYYLNRLYFTNRILYS